MITKPYGVLMILLALVISVAAQSPENSITGKVVSESGQPIPNASVTAYPEGKGREFVSVSTDREGAFKLTNLEAGPYYVSASMPSYINPLLDPRNGPSKQYKIGDSVTFVLIKGGVITGKVTNKVGNPVIDVGVSVKMIRDDKGRPVSIDASTPAHSTDDRGVYRIYGLPAGTYQVMAGGSQDKSGMGVSPYSHDTPTYAPSSTRDTASEVTLRTGEEVANIDITYRAERGRVISGVINGPATLLGPTVTLTSVASDGSQSNSFKFEQRGTREFSFQALAEGDYYVTAQTSDEHGRFVMSEPKSIRLRGADVEGVELLMMLLGSVRGRIVLEESKATECKDKKAPVLSEISVSAWHRRTEAAKRLPLIIWQRGIPVKPDTRGDFVLRNLAPAEYSFDTRFLAKGWYLRSITLGPPALSRPRDISQLWTTVKREELAGLTMTIAHGSASIQGVIEKTQSETTQLLNLFLVPAEPENATDRLRFYGVQPALDGKFELSDLAPGRYWIVTRPAVDDSLIQFRSPDEAALRAELRREAEVQKTEIEVKPCQNVEGLKVKGGD